MKKYFIYISLVIISAAAGSLITWVNSFGITSAQIEEKVSLEVLLEHSNTVITDSNYSCEGKAVKTVGAVAASIIELNGLYKRNRLSYGCFDNTCVLSVSSCMPWQSLECGSRILKFEIEEDNVIQKHTFTCIDMP
jgi:hypothetical protein